MKRGFIVTNDSVSKPKRSTSRSAGYDFVSPVEVLIKPGDKVMIDSCVRVYCNKNEYLACHIRSSLGSRGITLTNCTGIIDSDYFDTGNTIKMMLINNGEEPVLIDKGDRVMQGIFCEYLLADDDDVTVERTGGLGSTGN
ncbi:dUTP diphosphatase [Veillonella criceti]|uniref:dUTP diphosphatase n=1 Tax=Veillonella criceti TaxID=103891 RepID=A0A380NKA2_9FIRM|nr:dUTP diphosphatase [Veillonella criceti]SUP42290.1 Deoxyuridine 5'-triphosphate nucleotidohydrolase [Veillonella criceti]